MSATNNYIRVTAPWNTKGEFFFFDTSDIATVRMAENAAVKLHIAWIKRAGEEAGRSVIAQDDAVSRVRIAHYRYYPGAPGESIV